MVMQTAQTNVVVQYIQYIIWYTYRIRHAQPVEFEFRYVLAIAQTQCAWTSGPNTHDRTHANMMLVFITLHTVRKCNRSSIDHRTGFIHYFIRIPQNVSSVWGVLWKWRPDCIHSLRVFFVSSQFMAELIARYSCWSKNENVPSLPPVQMFFVVPKTKECKRRTCQTPILEKVFHFYILPAQRHDLFGFW